MMITSLGTTTIQMMKKYHINHVHTGDHELLLEIYSSTKYVRHVDIQKNPKSSRKYVLDNLYLDMRFDMSYEKVTLSNGIRKVRVFTVKDEYWNE